jgi:LmbE family N-acetylglucosaminyl deacetylase
MGTIVSFHAHPDDESIATGGTLARAADAGHRVVLVFATRGELGEPVPGVLGEGEQLTMRRTAECYESARVLGVERVEFLGYTDSGMMGEPTNDAPWCFWQADLDAAARRLAAILEEERPDIITIYDDIGGYGHPDHIQVHRVGKRAAEMASVPVVAQGSINRDVIAEAMSRAVEFGVQVPAEPADGEPDGVSLATGVAQAAEERAAEEQAGAQALAEAEAATQQEAFGKPEAELTHRVDVSEVLDRKRASMLAHASQIPPDHFLVSMPAEAFEFTFGGEWFIVDHAPGSEVPELFVELFVPKAVVRGAVAAD